MVSFWRGFSLKVAGGHFYASCLHGLFCVPAQRGGREGGRGTRKEGGRERARALFL